METLVKDLSLGTVAVSSTKGHVGHLLGASGAFEALVAVKSLEEGVAPGNLNLESVCLGRCGSAGLLDEVKSMFAHRKFCFSNFSKSSN